MNRLPDIPGVDWFGECTNTQKRLINRYMREHDDSEKAPINGRFNATERALERLQHRGETFGTPYEYYMALETQIGLIVNDSKNLPSAFAPGGSHDLANRWKEK